MPGPLSLPLCHCVVVIHSLVYTVSSLEAEIPAGLADQASPRICSEPDTVPGTHLVKLVCHLLTERSCHSASTVPWKTFLKAPVLVTKIWEVRTGKRGGPVANLGPGDPHPLTQTFSFMFTSPANAQWPGHRGERGKAVLCVCRAARGVHNYQTWIDLPVGHSVMSPLGSGSRGFVVGGVDHGGHSLWQIEPLGHCPGEPF